MGKAPFLKQHSPKSDDFTFKKCTSLVDETITFFKERIKTKAVVCHFRATNDRFYLGEKLL